MEMPPNHAKVVSKSAPCNSREMNIDRSAQSNIKMMYQPQLPYPPQPQLPYPLEPQLPYPPQPQLPYPLQPQLPYPLLSQLPYPVPSQLPYPLQSKVQSHVQPQQQSQQQPQQHQHSTASKGTRRVRTPYTMTQVLELENQFEKKEYINPIRRAEMASHLMLTDSQVKVWFQNRRVKKKKKQKAQNKDADQGFPDIPDRTSGYTPPSSCASTNTVSAPAPVDWFDEWLRNI